MQPKNSPETKDALWQLGFIRWSDIIAGIAIGCSWVTCLIVIWLTQDVRLLIVPICLLGLTQLWMISLIYRCTWFVIKVWADVKLLPVDAAKLALGMARTSNEP